MSDNFRIPRGATLGLLAIAAFATSAAAQKRTSGIDTSNFDRSIRPQDDFFRYVNGGWLKKCNAAASTDEKCKLRKAGTKALPELI